MFKKPLANLKTSAPLRSSDRRKLKQRVATAYNLSSEEGDLLVPDGLQSTKFMTHLDDPGVLYTAADGDPLWFTIGKGSDELIPTVYTLWKKQDLVPFLSTPSAVVPILIGGADLMIPGVIHCRPGLPERQLVSVRQYTRENGQSMLSPPLAVGYLALPSDAMTGPGSKEKGKAVLIYQTWKDHMFDLGSKSDPPPSTAISSQQPAEAEPTEESSEPVPAPEATVDDPENPPNKPTQNTASYSAQEVSELLNHALVHAISSTLGPLPPSSFPISATTFYSTYVLPSRPAFPFFVLKPATWDGDPASDPPEIDTEISVKSSSHKSLTMFLKAAEKASLLTLKAPPKHSQQTDVLVTSVNKEHPSVTSHKPFATVKDLEQKAAKKAAREEKETKDQQAANGQVEVLERWKPHLTSVEVLEAMGASKNNLYSLADIRTMINTYITTHQLVNPNDQAYINLDETLSVCFASKSSTGSGGKGKNKANASASAKGEPEVPKFMKRDELIKGILGKMQPWYEVRLEGKEPLTRKGTLAPIQVVSKMRQGRKACTLITGFEPFLVIDAEEMAEELRKVCAGAASVGPVPGKSAGSELEVMVQGKQAKAVMDYLMGKGIPKKWIEVSDLTGKK